MGFLCFLLLILLSVFSVSLSQSHRFNHTDMQAAVGDMRAQSFYGFAVILQMYLNSNSSTQHQIFNEEESLTFFMPVDRELSKFTLLPEHLEDFLLSHSMTMTLQFSDLIHFPTGTIVPSGLHDRLIKIQNHGKSNFYVNDAQVITPNVCINSMMIKCHGIDSVIKYENGDYTPNNRIIDRATAAAGTVRAPPKTYSVSPRPRSSIHGHQ